MRESDKDRVWTCCSFESKDEDGWGVVSCTQSRSLSEERHQPEGAALHPAKGGSKWNEHLADGALCICISALSASCSLSLPSCSTPEPVGIIWESSACWEAVWGAVSWLVSRGVEGGRHGCVAALGPCCLPSLLGAFRSFRVCSAGYCRFIKPQWLKHNSRQERGHGWTWTSAPAKHPLANQEALIRQLANSNKPSCCLPLPAYHTLTHVCWELELYAFFKASSHSWDASSH